MYAKRIQNHALSRHNFVQALDVSAEALTDMDNEEMAHKRRRVKRKASSQRGACLNSTDCSNELWTAGSAIFFAATTMATIGRDMCM